MTERTTRIAPPTPESGPAHTRPRTDLLPLLRVEATARDPKHASIYATMAADEWRDGADLAARILAEHAVHRMHISAGNGPDHRHTHAQAVTAVVTTATESELVAGVAMLLVAGRALDDASQTCKRDRP